MNEGHGRVVRRDLDTGEEKTLYSLDRLHNPIYLTASPDGEYLAFALQGLVDLDPRVMLVPTSGGKARELAQHPRAFPSGSITWSPDSRYVYFARRVPDPKPNRLYRVAVSGGPPEELEFKMKGLTELSMRPDGRQMAFTVFSQGHGELWVMENLLPKP